ncbi:MAG: LamG-like jellyroll fold domain-containing protein [Cyclobacteriaceae bacterium]
MKNLEKYYLTGLLLLLIGVVQAQQDCKDDINYSISNVTVNGGNAPIISNDDGSAQITIGQPYIGPSGSFNQGISARNGFWGHYILEPQGPRSQASEGEYVDRIEVEWEVVDDMKGPVVTGETTKIYRNGKLLTSVPISQTTYVDFNVFPGEFYTYGIVTSNSLGDAKPIEVVGFLNPNGRVTGKVETRNGAPVADVKVVLSPNLGRSLNLDGTNDYMYFVDQSYEFGEYYTIEGWWRNVEVKDQTIFVAVDSGTTVPMIKITLDANGKVHYYHDGNADGTGLELISKDGYNLDSFDRDWHHVAAVYDTANAYLYVDGNRVAEGDITESISKVAEIEMGKDGPKQYTGYYSGFLDDFRIWNVGRERAEIRKFKDITLTGEEAYLQAYWKFDEQYSEKIFDYADKPVVDRHHGFICDVTRSDFISPAELGAYTDEGGDYIIKGVYYGSGQTFQVTPSKKTSIGYSLDFDGTDDFISYQLDRLEYNSAFTFEGWFKSAVSGQNMVIFEATDEATNEVLLQIGLQSTGEFYASIGFSGNLSTVTSADVYNDEFWYHYAVVHDGSTVTIYIDGVNVGTTSDGPIANVLTRSVIGRSDPIETNAGSDYFNGSLDEMRIWNYARTENQLNATINQIIPGDEQGIVDPNGDLGVVAYWMLGEGRGSIISDSSPNGHSGDLMNFQETQISADETIVANWNGDDIPLDVGFFEHDFDPNGRNISLDPSNTSVDRVEFTDISQLGMSGFVKYANADCFAEGVEMKINGGSLVPPVFTNEEGKFSVELEPGSRNILLSANKEGFSLDPGYIELPQVVRPISGLKFEVTTTRNIKGVVAGGECLFPTGTADVQVVSIDGCYETIATVDATTGAFEAANIPPLQYEVSVINHNDTEIQASFDLSGAVTVDLREENDSISFIYHSETEIRTTFEGAEDNTCDIQYNNETATLLNQSDEYDLKIELFQVYGADTCVLNSGVAYIEDEISDFSPRDTIDIIDGEGVYTLKAGVPNLASPHNKSITVTGKDINDAQATGFNDVIVLGYKTLTSTFETTTPQLPLFILRDPAGDGSFAYLEQQEEVCNTMSFNYTTESTSSTEFTAHMGPDFVFTTGFFLSSQTDINVTLDLAIGASATNSFGSEVEYESCLTSSEIFKTSSNDLVSDGEGDVFVGGAMNVLVGTNRVVDINSETCAIELEDVVMILPNGFATTYVYTEQFIKNNVIPGLEAINDSESASEWNAILNYNESLKSSAGFVENISFSAGIEYEKSVSSSESSSSSMSLSNSFATEVGLNTGVTVNGMGFSLGVSLASSQEKGFSKTSEKSTTKTVGYSLNDDDIGDSFTMDIKSDAQGMPVFDLVAGESMCPWEPGTRNRIAANITPTSATSVVDVPEDEAGVFHLSISNTAESAEDQFFEVRVVQESNPNGATVLINGQEESVDLFIKASKSEDIVITIEKGPDAYVYTDLVIEVNAPCELERAEGLGLDIDEIIANDPGRAEFFSRQNLSVEFVKTCQDLTIFSPGDNWLVNNTDNNQLAVTVSDIDLSQAEFDQYKFQYRKQIEGEPFINGETVLSTAITGNSHSLVWDVSAVDDALYELRIVSECNSGFLPGTSTLTVGRIDREAPQLLGTASPADAVLSSDDEISITFNEDIKCGDIILLGIPVSLTQGSKNNVALSNTETGLFIEATVTCNGNKLIIVPDVQNKFLEEQVLRVDILGIEDNFGNVQSEQITWDFLVRRNPLEWQGGDIQSVSYEGESPSFVRQIKNNGAFDVNVNLSGALDVQTLDETLLPSWITASPRSFTLQPGATQDVTFDISDQIGGGNYNDVVTAATSFGAPELRFDVRVLCPEPNWSVNASEFENSMTFTGQLDIRGELSADEYDIVAAYVGSELRGVGHVQYAPELENIPDEHPYLLFMTLYTNSTADEMIEFQVWDASRCQLYGQIAESYAISVSTAALGSPTNPETVTVTNNIIQRIPMSKGWNWFSLNLNSTSSKTDNLLQSLDNVRGDIIKSQNQYSQYVESLGWVGPLEKMDSTKTFRLKLAQSDTLVLVGEPIDFETTSIELEAGWNWISFLPPVGMELNEALSGLSATADFIIKSQTAFAQYVDFQGWIGSLDFLRPNQGYLIFTDRPSTLSYPINNANGRIDEPEESVTLPEGWALDPSSYEHNGNMIIAIDGLEPTENDFIGLFSNDELVGWGQAQYLDFMNRHYFFVTGYAHTLTSEVTVKIIHNGMEVDIDETLILKGDQVQGTVKEPVILMVDSETLIIDTSVISAIEIYPNPFADHTILNFDLGASAMTHITLHNLTGQQISTVFRGDLNAGQHEIGISRQIGNTSLSAGVYVVRISINDEVSTKKLIIR